MVQPKSRRFASEAYAETAKAEAIEDATTKYGGLPSRIDTLESNKWIKGDVTSTGLDANNYVTSGFRGILTGSIANMPAGFTVGAFEVFAFGTGVLQRATTWEAIPKETFRRRASGVWSAWSEGSIAERVVVLEAAKWKKPTLAGGTDFNTVLTPGAVDVASASHPNQPFASLGNLETLSVNGWLVHRFTTTEAKPRVALRRYASSAWGAWEIQPTRAELDALTARISSAEAGLGSKSGMKIVPLTMTAPGTPLSTTTTVGAVRWVRRYAVMPKRVRVHVANRNTGNALNGNQALPLSHIRVGVGDAAGGYTQGVIAQTGGTLAADGSETITPWVTVPGLADGGYLNVTVSWSGGGGTATLQHNQGGGWTATDNTLSGSADVTGWSRSQTTPLHCWIEAEVPASTPVLLGNGDSITVGTATTDPVGDSYASVYAYNHGALPVILAMHGSTMANWTAGATRWTQYGTFDLNAVVDAIVTMLGQNDLAAVGMDQATLQARHTTFMAALRGIFPKQPVYLGTITPSNKSAALEQMRRDFNAWRATSAQQERGVLNFATVVGGAADEDLLPEYSADALHPNTEGQKAMAALVEGRPVTPYTLSPIKLKALAAL